jgi:hypothetical protein
VDVFSLSVDDHGATVLLNYFLHLAWQLKIGLEHRNDEAKLELFEDKLVCCRCLANFFFGVDYYLLIN